MTGPDPRYVTVAPPAQIEKSRADQILDHLHQQSFRRAVLNVVSTEIAEQTFAQILDGLPLKDVALDKRYHRHYTNEPVFNHLKLCPGILEKAQAFRKSFEPMALEVPSRVLHSYQKMPVGSRVSALLLVELVAVIVHTLAAEIFKLDGSLHKGDEWPSEECYESNGLLRWATPFSVIGYAMPDRYPDGVADVVGYWAEDRIFGGVVLFGRGESGTGHDGIWFHSHRRNVTHRIYALTDGQTATLLRFLDSNQETDGKTACPLPIVGDANNRQRIDDEIAMPEFNVYRDRWERPVDFQNHSDYRSKRHCVEDPLDYPNESLDAYVRTTTDT